MNRSIEETRQEAWRQIREMQERHRMELAPLIKVLTSIQALEPPAPFVIDLMSLTDKQREEWTERLKASGVIE